MDAPAIAADLGLSPGVALDRIHQILQLRAESATLTWHSDFERIKANAAEQSALAEVNKPREYPFEMNGFYRGMEDFCGLWALGSIDPLPFFWSVADYVAREVVLEFTTPEVCNCFGFAHIFGGDAVDALLAVLRGSAGSLKEQYRRLQASVGDEGDSDRFAAIGTDDPEFDEAYLVKCDAADEHAALITFIDLDEDDFEGLRELIEKKSDAAKRAYLAAPGAADARGYVLAALKGFALDPADSDHQRGYEAALRCVARECLGIGDDAAAGTQAQPVA